MSTDEFVKNAMPYFRKVFPEGEHKWDVLAGVLQKRVQKFTEIPEMIGFLKDLPEYPAEYFTNKKSKTNPEVSVRMLNEAIPVLDKLDDWSVDSLHDTLTELASRLDVKNGTLLWPVRIAAAGQTVTPGGAMEILSFLGKEESLKRLNIGLAKLNA